jgi:hypothetical protein
MSLKNREAGRALPSSSSTSIMRPKFLEALRQVRAAARTFKSTHSLPVIGNILVSSNLRRTAQQKCPYYSLIKLQIIINFLSLSSVIITSGNITSRHVATSTSYRGKTLHGTLRKGMSRECMYHYYKPCLISNEHSPSIKCLKSPQSAERLLLFKLVLKRKKNFADCLNFIHFYTGKGTIHSL